MNIRDWMVSCMLALGAVVVGVFALFLRVRESAGDVFGYYHNQLLFMSERAVFSYIYTDTGQLIVYHPFSLLFSLGNFIVVGVVLLLLYVLLLSAFLFRIGVSRRVVVIGVGVHVIAGMGLSALFFHLPFLLGACVVLVMLLFVLSPYRVLQFLGWLLFVVFAFMDIALFVCALFLFYVVTSWLGRRHFWLLSFFLLVGSFIYYLFVAGYVRSVSFPQFVAPYFVEFGFVGGASLLIFVLSIAVSAIVWDARYKQWYVLALLFFILSFWQSIFVFALMALMSVQLAYFVVFTYKQQWVVPLARDVLVVAFACSVAFVGMLTAGQLFVAPPTQDQLAVIDYFSDINPSTVLASLEMTYLFESLSEHRGVDVTFSDAFRIDAFVVLDEDVARDMFITRGISYVVMDDVVWFSYLNQSSFGLPTLLEQSVLFEHLYDVGQYSVYAFTG